MKTLTIYPENKEQWIALKGFFEAFHVHFEVGESAYDPKFVKMIRQGEKDLIAGKGVKVDIDKLFVEKVEKGLQDIGHGKVHNYDDVKEKFLNK